MRHLLFALALAVVPVVASADCVALGDYIHAVGETEDRYVAQQIAVGATIALLVSESDGEVIALRTTASDPNGYIEAEELGYPASAATFLAAQPSSELFAIADDDVLMLSVIDPTALLVVDVFWIPHTHGRFERLAATPGLIHAIDRTDGYAVFSHGAEMGSLTLPARPVGLAAEGTTAYVTLETDELVVIDSSALEIVGTLALARRHASVAASGGIVYLSDTYDDEVDVVDAGDPTAPVLLGSWTTPGDGGEVGTYEGFVFHAGRIYEVADPVEPVVVAGYESHNVLGVGSGGAVSSLYGSSATWSVPVIDVDPVAPVPTITSLPITASPSDISGDGERLVISYEDSGIEIYDISDPDAPALRSSLAMAGALGVDVAGEHAYVADALGLRVVDVSDLDAPTMVATVPFIDPPARIRVFGSVAMVGPLAGEYTLIDVSTPSAPVVGGHVSSFGLGDVEGDHLFVSAGITCEIYDISSLGSPLLVGSFPSTSAAWGFTSVEVVGDHCYGREVFESFFEGLPARMRVYDVSDPTDPVFVTRRDDIVGELTPDAYPYVYAGAIAYDFTDPTGPVAVGGVGYAHEWVGPERIYRAVSTLNVHPKQCGAVGVGESVAPGANVSLAARPDPMRSGTTFTFDAGGSGRAEVSIFDVAGRVVRTLESSGGRSGRRSVAWDGRDDRGAPAPPGVYVARLVVDGRARATRKVTIAR